MKERPVDKVAKIRGIWYNRDKGGQSNAAEISHGNDRGTGTGKPFLRKLEKSLDLSFVYGETAHLYSRKYGRPP